MKKENESYEVRQARRELEENGMSESFEDFKTYREDELFLDDTERRRRKNVKPKRRKRRRSGCLGRLIRFFVVIFLIVFGATCLILSPVKRVPLDRDKIQAKANSFLYKTVVFYGLDSREGEISGGVRSDVIMIASINRITGHAKIVSVYRDTFLKTGDGSFSKVNAGYNGGPETAVSMLNRNLDLGITDYVTVNFNSLADIIDAFGGVNIEVKPEEVSEINNFMPGTAKVIGETPVFLEGPGLQKLSGLQAVTYARIRSTAGDDFRRAYRQRIVLEALMEKAKHAGPVSLLKAAGCLTKNVQTSFSLPAMSLWAMRAPFIKPDIMTGFPFSVTTSENVSGYKGSYVIPIGLRENVIKLHEVLFGKKNYSPTETVNSISGEIEKRTGVSAEGNIPQIDTSQYTKTR